MIMIDYPAIDITATGKRIDQLRREKEMSVRDLQKVFGFSSPQAIYNWIWGVSLPSIDSIVILESVFEVKIDDIIVVC